MNILGGTFIVKFIQNKQGISAIEYAIMSAGIATMVLTIFKGQQGSLIYDMFDSIFASLRTKLVGN
ncbi:Flp family type IVb pilin [Gilliamella sp. Pas-s25]|uniref:Flp family type IVb pilin n=1 Tax=Gilliamella sp. Pas-s25 TaxID=2687310 RepID=UPI00135EB4F8|nr:Flp family type IVb pilin [Gilliamella sp. Pas-s25]MWP63294.1 Flp family type IVb pilin [Gilliamella sp. Pas-s25]